MELLNKPVEFEEDCSAFINIGCNKNCPNPTPTGIDC